MISAASAARVLPRAAAAGALLALGLALSGCADMSDSMTEAFADPAKYDLYDCKQLESERKTLGIREAELQGLMAKADTGVGGPVVAELAYRNDYLAVRGQLRFANEAWRKNKCRETPPAAAAAQAAPVAPNGKPASPIVRPAPASKAGGAVY